VTRPVRLPKLGSKKKRTGKSAVNRHEQKLADKLEGRRQPNSGSLPHKKGDISIEGGSVLSPARFLLDSKETSGSTVVLGVKDITKICREAMEVGKEPGLVVTFGQHPSIVPPEWVMIPLELFSFLLSHLKNS